MSIVYQTDKRSGITYAYENTAYYDKETKKSRSKRTLIGRVDPETKEIVPTDGRCKRLSPTYVDDGSYQMPKTLKECKEEIRRLLKENEALKEQLARLSK